ncbi:MAG: pantetheine-phosphate adenylyltransferase [Clostridia bacterium]|nr:pantetheine-phosphate adenylyltransferase [Clostridia bacterium]
MSLAIVPGSFDPMTLGHLDIVANAAKRYDEVIVAVMINPAKRYRFDMKMRVKIAECTVAGLSNVRVIAEKGLLIDLFDRLGADAVCKGWRDEKDYSYELRMADWNRAHNPRFRTELIHAKNNHLDVSSTEVRALLEAGSALEGYVHPDAIPLILQSVKEKP